MNADIALPDPYAYLDIGEKSLDYAMPWDQVKPLSYKKWDGQKWRLEELRKKSERRIESNPNFDLVKQSIAQVKEQKEQSIQPLKISEFLEKQKMNQLKAKKLDNLKPQNQAFKFRMLEKELEDSVQKETNQERLEQISSDIYLEEAVWILNDLTAARVMAEAA